MIRTQIQLKESQAAYIKTVAAEENISMAEVIRNAIELLRESRERPSKRELMHRSLAIVGKYNATENDVSVNHDEYLAETFGAW